MSSDHGPVTESMFPELDTPVPEATPFPAGPLKPLAPDYTELADQRLRDINESRGEDVAKEQTGVGVDTQPNNSHTAIAGRIRANYARHQKKSTPSAAARPGYGIGRSFSEPAFMTPEQKTALPPANPDGKARVGQAMYEATRAEMAARKEAAAADAAQNAERQVRMEHLAEDIRMAARIAVLNAQSEAQPAEIADNTEDSRDQIA